MRRLTLWRRVRHPSRSARGLLLAVGGAAAYAPPLVVFVVAVVVERGGEAQEILHMAG